MPCLAATPRTIIPQPPPTPPTSLSYRHIHLCLRLCAHAAPLPSLIPSLLSLRHPLPPPCATDEDPEVIACIFLRDEFSARTATAMLPVAISATDHPRLSSILPLPLRATTRFLFPFSPSFFPFLSLPLFLPLSISLPFLFVVLFSGDEETKRIVARIVRFRNTQSFRDVLRGTPKRG